MPSTLSHCSYQRRLLSRPKSAIQRPLVTHGTRIDATGPAQTPDMTPTGPFSYPSAIPKDSIWLSARVSKEVSSADYPYPMCLHDVRCNDFFNASEGPWGVPGHP